MSDAAAFSGSYCDMRFVKSRKVAQIVVEIPIEQAAAFVASFGAPDPAKECPVAIARLVAEPKQEAPKRKWADMPASQQAAIRCNEPAFQKFVAEYTRSDTGGPDAAASFVRAWCDVPSRSRIQFKEESGRQWMQLENRYANWLRGNA